MNHPSTVPYPLWTSFYGCGLFKCDDKDAILHSVNEWLKANPNYKKDKVFQALLWIYTNWIYMYYESHYYTIVYGKTTPSKKSVADAMALML